MGILTHNSKASSKKLPNSRVGEAEVSGGARFQGHDLTISPQRMTIFHSISSSLSFFSAHFRACQPCPLQPTRILRGSFGSLPTGLPPIPLHGLNTPTPKLGTPWSSCHSPGLFTEILKGQDFWDSQEPSSFPLTFQLRRTHSARTSEVGRESHLSGSQRLAVGDKLLNCRPLLMLNSQQSALRSAIITIHKNSPFVSCAWRAFET